MKLNKEILQKYNACNDGYKWYLNKGCNTVEETVEKLIKEGKFEWANWLVSNMLPRKNKVEYAVYAAELVLDRYEKKYPADKIPRKAVEAAKEWIKNPKNTVIAANADYAASVADVAATYASVAADAAAVKSAAAAATAAAYAAYTAANADYAAYAAFAAAKSAANAATYTVAAYTNARLAREKIIKYGLLLLSK